MTAAEKLILVVVRPIVERYNKAMHGGPIAKAGLVMAVFQAAFTRVHMVTPQSLEVMAMIRSLSLWECIRAIIVRVSIIDRILGGEQPRVILEAEVKILEDSMMVFVKMAT